MSFMDFHQLMSGIATLTPTQLKEAKARIALLDKHESSGSDNTDIRLVFDELVQVVERRTGAKCAPMKALMGSRYGASLREGSAELIEFAKQHLKPKGRAGMIQAVRLLVGLIVRQVQVEGKVRLALGPCCSQLKRVAEIVDQNFPGYLQSGLLPMVLNRRQMTRSSSA